MRLSYAQNLEDYHLNRARDVTEAPGDINASHP
jgi:hypothetical protein